MKQKILRFFWVGLTILSNGIFCCYIDDRNIDSLLKLANKTYKILPSKAMAIVKNAYVVSFQKKDMVGAVHCMNVLSQFNWQLKNYVVARIQGQNALLISENYHLDSLKGKSWMILGLIDHIVGNFQDAIKEYNHSISYDKEGNKSTNTALAYLNIGKCKRQLSHFNDAISSYLIAVNYFEQLSDKDDLANTYNSISLCFVSLKNYERAIDYNQKAIQIRKALKDHTLIAQFFNNIGYAFKEDRRADSASYYLKKSIAIYQLGADSSLLVLPLQNLGSTLKLKGQYADAAHDIRRSLSIAAKYSMPEELADGNLDLAELYLATNRYKNALVAVQLTETTAKTLKLLELFMKAYAAEYSQQRNT
jgi:tetratricopeptide (TPR) repeat protein